MNITLLGRMADRIVPPAELEIIFRCMNTVLPVPASGTHSKMLSRISGRFASLPELDFDDENVQKMALWHLWYKVQLDGVVLLCRPSNKAASGKNFSKRVLSEWSRALSHSDGRTASRFIMALIEFVTSPQTDVFDILSCLKVSPRDDIYRWPCWGGIEGSYQ